MYRLLIVDDEENIRKGIINFIDWNENDIEVCGEAEDGVQALERIKELEPDIMLIDIRMPEMSGLEVIERIYSQNLAVKSIIISGYDDFAYAQKALKLGVSYYLLKPCKPEEILDTVKMVKRDIETDHSKRALYQKLKIKFNENLPLIKNEYLNRFVTSKTYKNKMLENLEFYNINMQVNDIIAAVINIDNINDLYDRMGNEDLELMRFSIKNIVHEVVNSKFLCEIFENNDGIIMMANIHKNEQFNEFVELMNNARKFIRDNLDFTVSIGIGKIYEDINDMHFSYNEAIKALNSKFLSSADSVITYEDLHEEVIFDTYYPINEGNDILSSLRTSDSSQLDVKFENFFTKLNSYKLSKEIGLRSCLALVFSIYHLCVESNINPDKIFGPGLSIFNNLIKIDSLDRMKACILKIANDVLDDSIDKKSSNRIIEKSLKYIQENFHKDLNLEKVSGSVFVNPKYYCLLFKRIMGINFIDYLNKIRVEKACKLLMDISLKTYEIAHKVGFSDERYFFQIFKKYKGMTPTQYRGNIKF